MHPNRLTINRELVKILSSLVEDNEDLRFSQILQSFGFVSGDDEFYTEPYETLKRVALFVERYENNKEEK